MKKVLTELSYSDNPSKKRKIDFERRPKCWNKGVGFSIGETDQQEWDPSLTQEKVFFEELYSIKIFEVRLFRVISSWKI